VLRATIERTREIGTSERLADHYDAVFDCVEANRDRLGGAPAALLHGDVAKPNLFVTDDGGVGVDAESRTDTGPDGITPLTGSSRTSAIRPATSFAREDQLLNGFDSSGPERYAEALYKGYRERAGGLPAGIRRATAGVRGRPMLGRSGFIDQWATYLDEPIDRLVDRANAELRARLDAV